MRDNEPKSGWASFLESVYNYSKPYNEGRQHPLGLNLLYSSAPVSSDLFKILSK